MESSPPKNDPRYDVSCPKQTVTSDPTRKNHKAVFDSTVCRECPLQDRCPTQSQKQGRVLYFDEKRVKRYQSHQRIKDLPDEHQTLRNNMEATMKEFTRGMNHKGKLRVRGRFRTELWALCLAMGINLERIHRYLKDETEDGGPMKTLAEIMGYFCDYCLFWTKLSIMKSNDHSQTNLIGFAT